MMGYYYEYIRLWVGLGFVYQDVIHTLYWIVQQQNMRIFVSTPDETGTLRKTRLTLVDCNTTNQLLKRVSALCNIHHTWLIVKLKQQICNIRIVQGWPLQIYPLRQGSQIIVEILVQALKSKSPVSSSVKLGQIQEQMELEIEDNNTTGFADQKFSFFSDSTEHDWTKYFEDSLQQFLNAVRKQSIEQANNILKTQPEVNDEKVLGRLMNKKVKFLLNQIGECGRSALHWAVQDKNLEMVQFLLIKTCDPNIVSIDQYTPLQLAIVLRASSIFQTLVSHPKIDLNKVTKKGSALHVAIQNSQFTYAQKLLDAGANPETQNYQGITITQLCKNLKITTLKFKNSQQQTPSLPHILRGTVSRVSSFASRLKQRLLLINPFTDQFIIFEQQKAQQNMSLKQINSVGQVKQKSWGMKKQYYYFQVFANDMQVVFCVKNTKVGKGWVESIKKCVSYCKGKKEKKDMMVPAEDQLVQVFDDVNNSVQVHKRKVNKPKQKQNPRSSKRLTLMDLNPILQSVPQKTQSNPQSPTQSPTRPPQQKPHPLTESPPKLLPHFQIETSTFDFPNVTTIMEQPEDYLRQSQLLGSVVSNQLMSRSILGSSVFNSSRLSVFEDKPRVGFKDFQILKQLGNGSFGRVFLARHRKQQKLYALKVLNKKKLIAKKQLKYAVGQANILKKVQSPFIIKLYYSFQTPLNLYMAIDYCPYGDLTQLLLNSDHEYLPQKLCKFYIAQIILAIEYLHKNKIIYRDLKPQNVLIGQDGYIRLTDFNLSKENNFSMSFCGSPAYLSPEMLEKKGVGYEADIYGIGCVLYEMVVGQPPFFDQNIDILYQNIRTGKLKFPSTLPKPTKSLLTSLLQRNINKRLGVKSFTQIKQHEYFDNFEWQKLQKLEMKIPLQIQQKINDKTQKLYVIQEHGFKDNDYESNSQMINRIKGFSFVRDGPDFV